MKTLQYQNLLGLIREGGQKDFRHQAEEGWITQKIDPNAPVFVPFGTVEHVDAKGNDVDQYVCATILVRTQDGPWLSFMLDISNDAYQGLSDVDGNTFSSWGIDTSDQATRQVREMLSQSTHLIDTNLLQKAGSRVS